MATTFALIRANYCGSGTARGLLEQIAPTLAADRGFERSRARNKLLRDWADGKSSAQFRKYEWLRTGEATEPEVLANPLLRVEEATLTVAYPVLPGLYGADDLDSMEDLIRGDARQLRDVLLSPGNLITSCIAVVPRINPPERGELVWFQDLVCELTYYEAQTLT